MLVRSYATMWSDSRESRVGTFEQEAGRLRNHVLQVPVRGASVPFGELPVASLGAEDVEDVVASLDASVEAGELAWKTAANVWSVLRKMLDDAARHKNRALRVIPFNPARDVRGPDRGDARAKTILYPSEAAQLLASHLVGREYRRMYAILIYTGLRAGELEALRPEDVDLEHRVIHVSKSVERATGDVKSTKSGLAREVPIETALLPLLAKWPAPVWMPRAEARAVLLREHLRLAGVKRAALFANDSRQKPMTLHDLRGTHATWRAARGDEPIRIAAALGHSDLATTMGYVRKTDGMRASFGHPFGELPSTIF